MSIKPQKPAQAADAEALAIPNRRAHARHAFEQSARIAELDESGVPGASWLCDAFDLSRSGLGLRSRRMAYVGRLLLIELQENGNHEPRVLCGMVRQSRYEAGEGHILGIQFWALPRTPAVEQWLNDRAKAA